MRSLIGDLLPNLGLSIVRHLNLNVSLPGIWQFLVDFQAGRISDLSHLANTPFPMQALLSPRTTVDSDHYTGIKTDPTSYSY